MKNLIQFLQRLSSEIDIRSLTVQSINYRDEFNFDKRETEKRAMIIFSDHEDTYIIHSFINDNDDLGAMIQSQLDKPKLRPTRAESILGNNLAPSTHNRERKDFHNNLKTGGI